MRVVAPLVFVDSALLEAFVEVENEVLEEATLEDVDVCANTPPADLVDTLEEVEEAEEAEEGEELPDEGDDFPPQSPDVLMLCQLPLISPYVYSEPQP